MKDSGGGMYVTLSTYMGLIYKDWKHFHWIAFAMLHA